MMNKVILFGMAASVPMFLMETSDVPHLVLNIDARHKTRLGQYHNEIFRVNAWHGTARWVFEKVTLGQIVGVQGYLTQRQLTSNGEIHFLQDLLLMSSCSSGRDTDISSIEERDCLANCRINGLKTMKGGGSIDSGNYIPRGREVNTMEESISKILELAISQGIWAVLYIYLFFRMLKENKEREDRYQATIDRLSGNIENGIEKIQNKLECMTAAQDES